jgi:hypothetical protein
MKLSVYLNKISSLLVSIILASFLWSCGGSTGDMNPSTAYSDNGTKFRISVSSSGYSSNKYYVDGIEIKSLNLKKSFTYYFDLDDPSTDSHPLFIGKTLGGGTYANEYLLGIENSRTTKGILTFKVPTAAPSKLYYNCGLHSSMGGVINIIESDLTFTSNSPAIDSKTESSMLDLNLKLP